MIKIKTKRLIIRDHTETDLDDLHSLISNEQVMFYLPDIETNNIKESRNNLNTAIADINVSNREKYFFGIFESESNSYIGEIGFTKMIDCEEGQLFGLGYFIKEEFWGQGYTYEAAVAVVEYAFSELGAYKIESGCLSDNKASERIMIKLGMTKESFKKKHVLLREKLYDRVEYGLFKEDWVQR